MERGPWEVAAGRFEEMDRGELADWQRRMASRIVAEDRFGTVRRVGGVDAAYSADGGRVCAAAAVLELPGLESAESAAGSVMEAGPYLPGFFSLRELPAVLDAMGRLRSLPDLLLMEAHGRAHPRRFGAACHLGLALDLPVIGVAKEILVGSHRPPAAERGAWEPLVFDGETVGAVVRTRTGVRPVCVSVGHRIGLVSAVRFVLACTAGFRLPEPIRRAHRDARLALRAAAGGAP